MKYCRDTSSWSRKKCATRPSTISERDTNTFFWKLLKNILFLSLGCERGVCDIKYYVKITFELVMSFWYLSFYAFLCLIVSFVSFFFLHLASGSNRGFCFCLVAVKKWLDVSYQENSICFETRSMELCTFCKIKDVSNLGKIKHNRSTCWSNNVLSVAFSCIIKFINTFSKVNPNSKV